LVAAAAGPIGGGAATVAAWAAVVAAAKSAVVPTRAANLWTDMPKHIAPTHRVRIPGSPDQTCRGEDSITRRAVKASTTYAFWGSHAAKNLAVCGGRVTRFLFGD
jgi:hypothetical protein